MDDPALVERAAAGNREAFSVLVQRHAALVVGVAFAITRDRAIAEDIGQDTFVAAWRDLAKLHDRTRLGPWLAGIARNLAHNAIRKRARRRALDKLQAPPAAAATPRDELERMQLDAELHRVLDELPAAQREALIIYYFEQGSVDDVASGLGVTNEVAKQRLHRARTATRDRLTTRLEGALDALRPSAAFTGAVVAAIATIAVTDATAATTSAMTHASNGKLVLTAKLAIAVTLLAIVGIAYAIANRKSRGVQPVVDHAMGSGQAQHREVDPRAGERGSIAGTIIDEHQAPIAHAFVCAEARSQHLASELTRGPRCTASDDRGRYRLGELPPAAYRVSATAKPFRPGVYHPANDGRQTELALRAGEHRSDIDLVMLAGGVAITGAVSDISGGPIAHARIHAGIPWDKDEPSTTVEADDAGRFEMWITPGLVEVSAFADGYASSVSVGPAPGSFELRLTPESSIAGTVVDASTHRPVAGVAVAISAGESLEDAMTDVTDDRGKFRVNQLQPGRYVAIARTPNGYGHSAGSTRVGLGQHVDGVVIELYPAYQIGGRVVLPDAKRSTCEQSALWLHSLHPERYLNAERDPDGTLHVDGVLPGTYEVGLACAGYVAHDRYPPVVIADKDATGLQWPVELGATIEGHVMTTRGVPVIGAEVQARTIGGQVRDKTVWAGDLTSQDGAYKLEGLKAGTFRIAVITDQGAAPQAGWTVEVAERATVATELVLDEVGSIKGTIVDTDGKPVGRVHVATRALHPSSEDTDVGVRTRDDGTFTVDGLRPGDYRVTASRDASGHEVLRPPGSNDAAARGERTTVHASASAAVRLVVESQSGSIRGSVVDADGKAVSDAFVVAARESDRAGDERSAIGDTRWAEDNNPVLTSLDGTFTCTGLSRGAYTVRAFRRGGGEAVAEHVAVGATAMLRMTPTGSIEGTVSRDGGAPDEIEVTLRDPRTSFYRTEHYYKTAGTFAIRDLPPGHFTLSIDVAGGHKDTVVDLGEGEHKTGVAVELDALVTITGRVVDLATHQPVSGIKMSATAGWLGGGFVISATEDDRDVITDAAGRFTIANAPKGRITITGIAKDFGDSAYPFTRALRTLDGSGRNTVDVGDIPIVHRRIGPNDKVGELGLRFVEQSTAISLDQQTYKVSWIDPSGPAAKADIKVGDLVTRVDGIDVTGANQANGWTLMRAPPGTKLALGLARGPTVPIVLAP